MADRSDAGHIVPSPALRIEAVPEAAADLVSFGRQYWSLNGVSPNTREVQWQLSLPDLFLEHGMPY